MWEPYKKGFKAWLQLEKSLSDNSVEAYLADIEKLTQYLLSINQPKAPDEIQLTDLQQFLHWILHDVKNSCFGGTRNGSACAKIRGSVVDLD